MVEETHSSLHPRERERTSLGLSMASGFRDHRGFTLMELIIAALVFSLVGLAIGSYYVFSIQRVEEGFARAELQRNASLVVQALGDKIQEAFAYQIPAEGEGSSQSSITIDYCPEPFDDENLNGQWDASGAKGPCAPSECFQDLNGNNTWDVEVNAARSFRLNGDRFEMRAGDISAPWEVYLDDRYPEPGVSSVHMDELTFSPDAQDVNSIDIRFVLRDDFRTSSDGRDDLRQAFELRVHREG
jgi:prepilin-type N-terminal cleavage/methylation domain-containing protein